MALNFSRPDPSSPAAVGAAQFSVARRGYDQEEVRDFLRMVSAELARLQERERFLESEMRAMQTRGLSDPGVLDEATVTQLLGAEAARVLAAAREASESMRQRAAESAEQLIREASHEASRLIDEAQLEAARRRSDLAGEVEAEIELAKQQGREMVAEVRAYREKVLADLARRSEEARRELERLVVERERLLGAFERARLAASDVVGELVEEETAQALWTPAVAGKESAFDHFRQVDEGEHRTFEVGEMAGEDRGFLVGESLWDVQTHAESLEVGRFSTADRRSRQTCTWRKSG